MQTTAKLNNLRIAPRKVRLLVDAVRGKKVSDAIKILNASTKDAALPVRKLIESAVANARHNHKMDESSLTISTAFVDGGKILHRWMPRAMGRATPIRKRTSHITIVLDGVVKEAAPKQKEEKKETATKKEEKAPVKKGEKKKVASSTKAGK